MRLRRKSVLALGAGLLVAAWGPVRGEDTRHKWQFGGGISYMSTEDNIRSDADQAGCEGVFPDLSCPSRDPRPDANLLNEASIQDDFEMNLYASYGVTRFFALELSGGYFQGSIESIEAFRSYEIFNPVTQRVEEQTFTDNNFIQAAEITEIPIRISGLFRFRPESPFAPYVGAGIGYIFNDLQSSGAVEFINSQLNVFQQTDVDAPYGADGIVLFDPSPGLQESLQTEPSQTNLGVVTDPIQVTVNDGLSFHLRGGVDYYFTKKVSLYIDGTYTWTNPAVEIRFAGSGSGQATIREFFSANGGADTFPGPFALENGIRRAATAADTCRDNSFSGLLQGSRPECLGDDLNNNFALDPGEDPGLDGFFNRAFGVCVSNCTGLDGMGNPVVPVYEARYPGDSTLHGTLVLDCIAGSQTLSGFPDDPSCPPAGNSNPPNSPRQYEWVNFGSDNQEFFLGPADDLVGTNNLIIQGGEIDLEGFSLGVGVKFTF